MPISLVAQAPLSIAVSNKRGASDLKALIATAKSLQGRLNFAGGSVGSAGHLCTARLEQAAGISLSIVPYKGTAPAFQDLVGGPIEGVIDPVLGSVQVHRGKQLQQLCALIEKEVPPDAPLVVAGDFNDWRQAGHLRLRRCGMTEVFVAAHGKAARTYPARWPLLRLDRIYARNAHSQHALVLPARPWSHLSDHAPLAAEFEV